MWDLLAAVPLTTCRTLRGFPIRHGQREWRPCAGGMAFRFQTPTPAGLRNQRAPNCPHTQTDARAPPAAQVSSLPLKGCNLSVMTSAFLDFSKSRGNDLSTPMPEFGFPGLQPGDRWCLCASRGMHSRQTKPPRGVGAPAVTHCYSPEGPRAILLCAVYRLRLRPTTRTVIPKKKNQTIKSRKRSEPSALLRLGRAPSSIALFARDAQPPAAMRCRHGRAIRPFVARFAVDAAAPPGQGKSLPHRQANWMPVSIAFECPD